MKILQKSITLPAYKRGYHLITSVLMEKFPELSTINKGMIQVFIKHTSASLTINENADSTVRGDFERHFNHMIPENAPHYQHTYEGPDDMPAHLKASILGNSLSVPITNGKMNLGIWQGIYLCEHRNYGGQREIVLTAFGE